MGNLFKGRGVSASASAEAALQSLLRGRPISGQSLRMAKEILPSFVDRLDTAKGEVLLVAGSNGGGQFSEMLSDTDVIAVGSADRRLDIDTLERFSGAVREAAKRLAQEGIRVAAFATAQNESYVEGIVRQRIRSRWGLRKESVQLLHLLFYPSEESVLAWEPERLARALFTNSTTVIGDDSIRVGIIERAASGRAIAGDRVLFEAEKAIAYSFITYRSNTPHFPIEVSFNEGFRKIKLALLDVGRLILEEKGVRVDSWADVIGNASALPAGMVPAVEEVGRIKHMRGLLRDEGTLTKLHIMGSEAVHCAAEARRA